MFIAILTEYDPDSVTNVVELRAETWEEARAEVFDEVLEDYIPDDEQRYVTIYECVKSEAVQLDDWYEKRDAGDDRAKKDRRRLYALLKEEFE
jgi:hypothetical protein